MTPDPVLQAIEHFRAGRYNESAEICVGLLAGNVSVEAEARAIIEDATEGEASRGGRMDNQSLGEFMHATFKDIGCRPCHLCLFDSDARVASALPLPLKKGRGFR